jgi:serine phosphatase RsbU (regulator of sigma subunit)
MSLRQLSFKYKLALSFSAIIIGIVAVAFLLIGSLTKQYVVTTIESEMVGTCTSVARLMEEHRARLEELAVAVASDYLIRTILTDKGMDRVTRDDILDSVVLPSHSHLKLLAVLNTDASIRAISTKAEVLKPLLIRHPAIARSLEGRPAFGFIPHEDTFFQIAAIPVRRGIYVQEMIGAVVVGMPWSIQDLNAIRELSHAEIAFFNTNGVMLSTGPPFTPQLGKKDSAIAWSQLSALPSDRPSMLPAGLERFIVIKIGTQHEVSPGYIVARSLDQQLEFWNRMWSWLLELGIGGVLIGCVVSLILSRGISRPIHILQSAFRRVAQGDYKQQVTVRNRDEFAELATAFNRMQEDLTERAHMKHALLMAEEVQRSLLPVTPPRTKHLDIAGASIYCDAIGGDYYDFLESPQGAGTVRIVLGDVSGHGTAAALLTATSRALLRSRSAHPGPIEDVVGDVNRELSLDMKESGQFLTLFLVEIDPENRQLRWVRAGHEPAILFFPATEIFENLGGPGLALGIDAAQVYTTQSKSGLCDGQVILLGTDGLCETRNPSGEMFGKDRLIGLLRRHAQGSAEDITGSVLEHLKAYQGIAEFEDDATIVVVKMALDECPSPRQLDTSHAPS